MEEKMGRKNKWELERDKEERIREKAMKSGHRADQNEMMRLRRELSTIEGDTS